MDGIWSTRKTERYGGSATRGPFGDTRWTCEPTEGEMGAGEPLWSPPSSPSALKSACARIMPGSEGVRIQRGGTGWARLEELGRIMDEEEVGGVQTGVRDGEHGEWCACGGSRYRRKTDGGRVRCGGIDPRGSRHRNLERRTAQSSGDSDSDASAYGHTTDDDNFSGSDHTEDDAVILATPHGPPRRLARPSTPCAGYSRPSSTWYAAYSRPWMISDHEPFVRDTRWYDEPTTEEIRQGKEVGERDIDLHLDLDMDRDLGPELELGGMLAQCPAESWSKDVALSASEASHSTRLTLSRTLHRTPCLTTPTSFDNLPRQGGGRLRTTRSISVRSPPRPLIDQINHEAPFRSASERAATPCQITVDPIASRHVSPSVSGARHELERSRLHSTSVMPLGYAAAECPNVRRSLFPEATRRQEAHQNVSHRTREQTIDGWNALTPTRAGPLKPTAHRRPGRLLDSPSPASDPGSATRTPSLEMRYGIDSAQDLTDDWSSDEDYIRSNSPSKRVRRTLSMPSTHIAPGATYDGSTLSDLPINDRPVSDQQRHIGTHLSAKYGLDEMFDQAIKLLSVPIEGGNEGAGGSEGRSKGLGGLSFFLGCPKRHPKPLAAHTLVVPEGTASETPVTPDRPGCGRYGESQESGKADTWSSRVDSIRAGIAKLESLDPGFSSNIFVHSHETGNLALAEPSPTATSAIPESAARSEKLQAHRVMIDGYRAQMQLMSHAGLTNLVVHPGAANRIDADSAVLTVSHNLDVLLAEFPSIIVYLESMTCSGRGSLIGTTLPCLAAIRASSRYPDRIRFCLDLCHIHSASHDLSTTAGRAQIEADVDEILGRENVGLVHVSECGVESGSGGDVHRPFGQGHIGSHAIRQILRSDLFNPATSSTTLSSPTVGTSPHPPPNPVPSGPVIIIETPRYLPPASSSRHIQSLETRRMTLDIAYLDRLTGWDDETYTTHWNEWEKGWYKPNMSVLRGRMRRCITPGSKGEERLAERVRLGRQGRARIGQSRKRAKVALRDYEELREAEPDDYD